MTAKEFLQQYGEAVRIADMLRIEYKQELELLDSIRSPLNNDGTPRGNGISRSTETKAIRLADKAHKLKEAELEAVRIRQIVFDAINKIPGDKGNVLYERYINLKSWDEVAEAVCYSKRHAYNLHEEALAEIKDCI